MKFSSFFRPPIFILLLISLGANFSLALHPYLDIGYQETSATYGDRDYPVLDVSKFHLEADAPNYPGIKTIKASVIFKPGTVFLGFGLPNVFTARISEDGHLRKFDVKSLHRAESTIVDSEKGIAQSGYFIVLKKVPVEAIERVVAKAEELKGRTYPSCSQGNYELLRAAGFSIRSEHPSEKYFLPSSLLTDILTKGITYNGQRIEYDIVKTTPLDLKDFMAALSKAIRNTFYRHWTKSRVTEGYRDQALAHAAEIDRVNAELHRNNPASPETGRLHSIETSEPSAAGTWGRWAWGAHTIYKIALGGQNEPQVRDYLPRVLKEFPNEAPDCKTRIKRRAFRQGNVSWIRSKMAYRFSEPRLVDESHILDLLTPHTEQTPNVFNFVVTDDHIFIGKISVQWGLVDWILSKHVLLSNYAPNVLFAGEMKNINGVVVINRLSGSYQPDEEELKRAVMYARVKFPYIPIKAEGLSTPDSGLEDEKRPNLGDQDAEEKGPGGYTWVDPDPEEARQALLNRKGQ